MCVRWGNAMSSIFTVHNGVKQGGVISPVLYNLYTDNLLTQLKQSGLGCYIEHVFSGALGYADDLVLLAPSLHGITSMISICELYAVEYDIMYNPKKSKLICFNVDNPEYIDITLCGKPVSVVNSVTYLGNHVGNTISDRGMDAIMQNFWYKHNCTRSSFNMVNSNMLYKLHLTYCMNIYGNELFNYNCNYVNKLYTIVA